MHGRLGVTRRMALNGLPGTRGDFDVRNGPDAIPYRCIATLCRLLAGFALATGCGMAQAQEWPAGTVTVVVPFAAGGNPDIMARVGSQKLAEAFKQSFIVDNRLGAGGALAANYVAQAAPDGYTLFFA